MTGNLKLLRNFMDKFMGMVKFGNDQFALNLGYGDLVQGKITIKRFYYVKGLNHDLFSIGQFCDANLEVVFRKSTCYVRDLKGNVLLIGSRGTDLYSITLQDTTSPNPIYLMAKASSSQAWLYHHHLSHLNFDTINLLSKNDIMIAETVATLLNELDMLFSLMFDEYFTGATTVVSKSSTVPTTDASNKHQQSNKIPPTSTTIAADLFPLIIQTTPEPTILAPTQAPTITATENND
nr:retrovirus-related Pol polyprotein from transposon TNT 1-94 [Tanacetum cinerariifolium]